MAHVAGSVSFLLPFCHQNTLHRFCSVFATNLIPNNRYVDYSIFANNMLSGYVNRICTVFVSESALAGFVIFLPHPGSNLLPFCLQNLLTEIPQNLLWPDLADWGASLGSFRRTLGFTVP